MARKKLKKHKEQLKQCEAIRTHAVEELKKAKRTVAEMKEKLATIDKSREIATEEARNISMELEGNSVGQDTYGDDTCKPELDNARKQYEVVIAKLYNAKQDLRKMKNEFEASSILKVSSIQKEKDAKKCAHSSAEQQSQLSEEITFVEESLMQINLASKHAKKEELKILAEKDSLCQSYKVAMEEIERKLASLKKVHHVELVANLEIKLAETSKEIELVQKKIQNSKISKLNFAKTLKMELHDSKEILQKVAEEGIFLHNLLESLKSEHENVMKEHVKLEEKETESDCLVNNLHVQIQRSKVELERAILEESKARAEFRDLMSSLEKLTSESENVIKNSGIMKKNTQELMGETKEARFALIEAEKKHQTALIDAEKTKNAKEITLNQIKLISENSNQPKTSTTSGSGTNIVVTAEKFKSFSQRAKDSERLAEIKMAPSMAQLEVVIASEKELNKKINAIHEEGKEIELATQDALKKAELHDAARIAMEQDLKGWRERDLVVTELETLDKEPSAPTKVVVVKPKIMSIESMMKRTIVVNRCGIFHCNIKHAQGASSYRIPGRKSVCLLSQHFYGFLIAV